MMMMNQVSEKEKQEKIQEALKEMDETLKPKIEGLLKLDEEREKIQKDFEEEVRLLELKYDAKYQPIYAKRFEAVTGTEAAAESGIFEEAPKIEIKESGIEDFWLKAMKNNASVASMVTDKDEEILKHLAEIKYKKDEKTSSFTITFYFTENEWFTNKELVKHFAVGEKDEIEKITSTEITWNDGKDITKKQVKKKQKNKKSKETRVVTKTVDNESFFNFFKSYTAPESPEDVDEEGEELMDMIETDYDIGCEFHEELIPKAVNFFLGVEGMDDMLGFDDDEDDEDDDEDDDDDEEGADKKKKKKNRKASKGDGKDAEQCKQQ
mmetsp:Transcript_30543/g.34724  ORF Transcript_30543/g.34724 Transcript_30543/m.34724 type:complete len:323 (+) Transcript_30543:102-1070(+)|eukprot:CAMPEP_0115008088 /NCGR_PEP_ID=MMETSP0216-20121206/21666_1 /TAXON_ID=223996 /ORGANISM="Protocruzia adherens, Strain Boccale" /LENGTH=322 /DNA_ID=CAMNT_0002375353 /DNA_START=62 /DNA_END=1030 /DNA_ORIENTATION=-